MTDQPLPDRPLADIEWLVEPVDWPYPLSPDGSQRLGVRIRWRRRGDRRWRRTLVEGPVTDALYAAVAALSRRP